MTAPRRSVEPRPLRRAGRARFAAVERDDLEQTAVVDGPKLDDPGAVRVAVDQVAGERARRHADKCINENPTLLADCRITEDGHHPVEAPVRLVTRRALHRWDARLEVVGDDRRRTLALRELRRLVGADGVPVDAAAERVERANTLATILVVASGRAGAGRVTTVAKIFFAAISPCRDDT